MNAGGCGRVSQGTAQAPNRARNEILTLTQRLPGLGHLTLRQCAGHLPDLIDNGAHFRCTNSGGVTRPPRIRNSRGIQSPIPLSGTCADNRLEQPAMGWIDQVMGRGPLRRDPFTFDE
jgi:hypothetical protein